MSHDKIPITTFLNMLFESLERIHDNHFGIIFVLPDRQWCAPVTLARDRPVFDFAQPFAETPFFDIFWLPIYFFILSYQFVAQFRHRYIPRIARIVDKPSLAPPAERIRVSVGFFIEKKILILQIFQDLYCCRFLYY